MHKIKKARRLVIAEVLVVILCLGMIAAMTLPRFTVASVQIPMTPVSTLLKETRMQIELFKLQHRDAYPKIDSTWAVMLNKSTASFQGPAADAAGGPFGPYLHGRPVNPLNNSSSVENDFSSSNNATGWVYSEGKLRAVVPSTFKQRAGSPFFYGKPSQNNEDFIFIP